MTNRDDITLLDCTLRDGGYYTSWDFSLPLVRKYIDAVGAAGIDAVEIGFRFFPKENFLGAYAYSTDDFITFLNIPDKLKIAVMCNAKDLLNWSAGQTAAVNTLFKPKDQSPVDIVRIAVDIGQAKEIEESVRRLRDLGYVTTLNLMKAGSVSLDIVANVTETLKDWPLDTLYFADSLGNMSADQVSATSKAILSVWDRPLGIHAHNNMGRAVDNSLAALNAGCTWLDSTICGMGRGAGNAQTEYILLEMAKRGFNSPDLRAVMKLAMEDFRDLHQQHGWGPSALYYISAIYGIHPTYVQELLRNDRHEATKLLDVLESLRDKAGSSFSADKLDQAIDGGGSVDFEGSWDPTSFASDRDVLLIAGGNSLEEHCEGLRLYIHRNKPLVLSVGINEYLPANAVDAYVLCHPNRLYADMESALELGRPIIAPRAAISDEVLSKAPADAILDYGVSTQAGQFRGGSTSCVIPRQATALYALAIVAAIKPNRLLLAGFDGYTNEDRRGVETNEALHRLLAINPGMEIRALTPTHYPIEQGSVYAGQ